MKIKYEKLKELTLLAFENSGFEKEEALACTEELIDAEFRAKKELGIAIIDEIIEYKKYKKDNFKIEKETKVSAFIEGNGTIGSLLSKEATNLALKKAKKMGIGIIGVRNESTFITTGYYPKLMAKEGFIGVTLSVAKSRVAPYSCNKAILGTNPLAIAIPTKSEPIVLDMATATIAAAKIRFAKRTNSTIPIDVACDEKGNPTIDPMEAIKGVMSNFGGYKGAGLALMIELLGGAFVGGKSGISSKGKRGMLFLAIDSDLFGFSDYLKEASENLIKDIKEASSEPIHIPGRDFIDFTKSIEIDDKFYENLVHLSKN